MGKGIFLLNLREDEGQEEVLEDTDEEDEESEVDEKVKEVRENAQLMHATWSGRWDGMRRKRKHLEPMCDVQRMSVTTAKQRLTTKTATLRACSRVLQVFKSLAHIVGYRVVLRVDLVLRVVNGVLVAVIVHSICIPNSCMFHISKTDLFRCCLYTLRRLQ